MNRDWYEWSISYYCKDLPLEINKMIFGWCIGKMNIHKMHWRRVLYIIKYTKEHLLLTKSIASNENMQLLSVKLWKRNNKYVWSVWVGRTTYTKYIGLAYDNW